jgi:type II secretory pathway predicted ATPase ExeA
MSPTLLMPSRSTAFFSFSHRPFRGMPDTEDYVAIDAIEQEVQRLAVAAAQGDGIAVLTAVPGAGKTLVCQRLQAELQTRFEVVLLSSSGFGTRRALLQAVLYELGQSYESCSEQELRLSVLNYGRTLAASREGVVLIIDEAHLLNTRLLEELRCLTNHSQAGRPLIRVVLCGQLPLEDALVDPALEALNYRITCHATLEPLSMQESAQLIGGRLQRAGRRLDEIFTPEALETICRVSDGNPRCLLQLCDESLRIAAGRGEAPVEAESVRLALHDLKQLPLQWNESAIDQTRPAAALADAAAVAGEARPRASSIDDPLEAARHQAAFAAGEGDLDWSASVSSVELGADCGLCETPPSTAGWSSFEPQSGWEPSGAAPADENGDETDDSNATFPKGGFCDDATSSAPLLDAGGTCWSDRMADRRVENVEVAAVPIAGNATHAAGNAAHARDFLELPVEDAYAALDARKPRASAACDPGSFDHMLRSTVTAATHGPRESVREPISDAEPTGRCDAVIDQSDDSQADSVRKLDAVIAPLPTSFGSAPAEPTSLRSEWQSAGDCRAFDVLEPGGEPQCDQLFVTAAAERGIQSPKFADRLEQQHNSDAAAAYRPVRRPYARLFSRARRQPS